MTAPRRLPRFPAEPFLRWGELLAAAPGRAAWPGTPVGAHVRPLPDVGVPVSIAVVVDERCPRLLRRVRQLPGMRIAEEDPFIMFAAEITVVHTDPARRLPGVGERLVHGEPVTPHRVRDPHVSRERLAGPRDRDHLPVAEVGDVVLPALVPAVVLDQPQPDPDLVPVLRLRLVAVQHRPPGSRPVPR